jgi:hypothetical protein
LEFRRLGGENIFEVSSFAAGGWGLETGGGELGALVKHTELMRCTK